MYLTWSVIVAVIDFTVGKMNKVFNALIWVQTAIGTALMICSLMEYIFQGLNSASGVNMGGLSMTSVTKLEHLGIKRRLHMYLQTFWMNRQKANKRTQIGCPKYLILLSRTAVTKRIDNHHQRRCKTKVLCAQHSHGFCSTDFDSIWVSL